MLKFLLYPLFAMMPFFTFADGINFFHGTWEEALVVAQEEEKLIFVDAFTTWCGPCKRMSANIFPQGDVGEFYNENFINVKLDMEKGEGIQFRQKYAVTAFPTLLFVDGKGELAHKHIGGMDAPRFIQLGKTALSKVDYSKDYAAEYEDGKRDPDLLHDYSIALLKSKKPSIKVANEYLRTQDNLTTDKNLKFIHAMAIESDSRIFSLMAENKSAVIKLVGQEAYEKKVGLACWNTVLKSIEYESDFLLEDAKKQFKENYPSKAAAFALKADMVYLKALGEPSAYIASANKFFKKADDPADEMHQAAISVIQESFPDPLLVEASQGWAEKACKKSTDYKRFMTLTRVYLIQEDQKKALESAEKALELAKAQNANTRQLESWVRSIKEKQ